MFKAILLTRDADAFNARVASVDEKDLPEGDVTLKVVDSPRALLPGLDLAFNNPPARYDSSRDTVVFTGEALGSSVSCAISREALDDHFGADDLDKDGRVETFLKNRSTIERMARTKYLSWPVEEPGTVLIKTDDVPKL